MGKIVGITYDLKSDWEKTASDPSDINAEFDYPETIDDVSRALEEGGHTVKRIGNVNALLKKIDDLGVDIVFNLCEGVSGRNRESQVPVLLEMKGIPYVGSDGLSLAMTLDKVIAKKMFVQAGVSTPRFFSASSNDDVDAAKEMGFPLMVKTRYEGSSKGISEKSKVQNIDELKERVRYINETYSQPALVEEFIKGTEFTVAVLGNDEPEAMPVVQVSIDGNVDLGENFYTYERISSDALQYVCPAKISDELTSKIQGLAVKAYKAVECRDFGRVDFRVDENKEPYVLEINPLPSLMLIDVFNLFPQVIGSTYNKTINQVLDFALERYDLK